MHQTQREELYPRQFLTFPMALCVDISFHFADGETEAQRNKNFAKDYTASNQPALSPLPYKRQEAGS
jgi:hypothetical protein